MSELMESKQLAVLEELKGYFLEEGVPVHLLEKSPALPVSVLVVVVGNDYKGRERTINLAFLPVGEDDFRAITALQLFSSLPEVHYPLGNAQLNEILLLINHKTALGNFSFTGQQEIALRHIHTMPKFGVTPKDEIIEVVTLFRHMLDLFGPKIEAVVSGEKTAQDVLRELHA